VPLAPFNLDLSTAGERQIVPRSNRINSFNALSISPGVTFYLKLGNNPEIGPCSDMEFLTLTFGGDYPPEDVEEGVQFITRQAFAGARCVGYCGMTTRRAQ
jgi:hypothetical protein